MRKLVIALPSVALLALPLIAAAPAKRTTEVAQTPLPTPTPVVESAAPNLAPPATGAPTAAGSMANYAIDWYSINGGGAINATSTNYQMGASIGQSVAGTASSANYQMGIGFWYGAGGGDGCNCPNLNDPDPNGVPDIVDVGLVINRAFRGAAALLDPGCPQERTDVDGSGATDIVDVGLYINVAFRGANEAATFDDDGCTPGNQ